MSKKKGKSTATRSPSCNKHDLPRAIPSDIKLEVRKRCGFGCVICGLGIYEYEHFSPEFKDASSHNPDGITLLCPNHHARKTKGLLSRETIERFNKNPKALSKGFVNEEFDLYSEGLIVVLGTVYFKETPVLIQINDEPILSISHSDEEGEPYAINAILRNELGNIIMEIEKNEWRTTTGHWDCKTIGSRIQIRNAPRNIELIIRQIPPNELHIERLTMVHRGCKIELHEDDYAKFISPSNVGVALKDFSIENFDKGLIFKSNGEIVIAEGARGGVGYLGLGIIKTSPDVTVIPL